MKKERKILVFPGCTEIAMEIWRSLRYCKGIKLYSAGAPVSNHAPYVFLKHFVVPNVFTEGWLEELNDVIEKEKIDYIFPAHDETMVKLILNAEKIKAKVISSPAETCLVTRSKNETYRLFSGIIPVPKVYKSVHLVKEYPVFVKPDKSQGSQDTHLVFCETELLQLLKKDKNKNYLILEYLPGREYTIDCFSDRQLGLLFCSGRERTRIRNGIAVNSKLEENALFKDYAKVISQKLTFYGSWFFQLKEDREGVPKLLEIGPRIAGTMALNRVRGVNFALLNIYEHERIPFEIFLNPINVEVDRALTNRYRHSVEYNVVYVDLDDTIIGSDGKINVDIIRFLFQCLNNGVKVVLLTKHDGDVNETLIKYRIKELFDEIIKVDPRSFKADYIKEKDAILVDDSFMERKVASEKLGILTFDCSMIEMLIDERK